MRHQIIKSWSRLVFEHLVLNISYLEISCPKVSQENEAEVEKQIMYKDYIIKIMVQLLTGLGDISSIIILWSQIIILDKNSGCGYCFPG